MTKAYSPVLSPCYYCGMPADTVDHVVPQTLLARLAIVPELREELSHLLKVAVVYACRQCNSILADRTFRTLIERRAYVKHRLRTKYSRLLNAPEWTEEEITELGYSLETYVRGQKSLRMTIRARIKWPH